MCGVHVPVVDIFRLVLTIWVLLALDAIQLPSLLYHKVLHNIDLLLNLAGALWWQQVQLHLTGLLNWEHSNDLMGSWNDVADEMLLVQGVLVLPFVPFPGHRVDRLHHRAFLLDL